VETIRIAIVRLLKNRGFQKKIMLRRITLYLILIVFFFGSLFVMSMIPSKMDKQEEEIAKFTKDALLKRVTAMMVEPRALEETILIPGMVKAYEDVSLGAVIPGVIEKIHVKEGDHVPQGKELFLIDLRSRLAIQTEAIANHELARKTLERRKKLRERGDVTIQEYDEAVAAEGQAAAVVRRCDVEVSQGKITAPIAGIIDRVDVEEGEYMHEGAQLARLLDIDRVKIVAGIPELYVDAVARQKQAVVFIDGLNEERTAVLERIAYAADTLTNTFEATLRLDNPDHRIRPGMIVRTRLITKQIPNALIVPLFSLVKRESGMILFVEKEGTVEARPVTMGAVEKDQVEITQGLSTNEHVIVVGQKDLVHGQRVEVMEIIPQHMTFSIDKELQ
jgi:membrane fusion protein (multidrug efflux system)